MYLEIMKVCSPYFKLFFLFHRIGLSIFIFPFEIFLQTLECLADTRWELRRMAHQVLNLMKIYIYLLIYLHKLTFVNFGLNLENGVIYIWT